MKGTALGSLSGDRLQGTAAPLAASTSPALPALVRRRHRRASLFSVASLKPTARKFVQTSFALLEPKIVDKKAERFGPPRWERSAGETFMLREPMISAQEWCLIDEAPRLSKLPESSLLTAALQRDSRIGPLLGKLVGTPTMSSPI